VSMHLPDGFQQPTKIDYGGAVSPQKATNSG
jgi:hypothetical protein